MHKRIPLLAGLLFGISALAGETDTKIVATPSPLDDSWRFSFALPAWAFWLQGDNTINGHTAHIDLAPNDIIPRIDMAADVRFEAHKGRFSVLGEFLYLGLSDGIGTNTVVKKLDAQLDQSMAELGVAWRVYETSRSYIDVIGGIRYTNFYQKVVLQPNDERIGEIAEKIASVGAAVDVARALRALEGKDPTLPIAPLEAGEVRRLTRALKSIKGTALERKERASELLHNALDRKVSRLDDWWDPYIGVRARYNLSDKFYVQGKADIGGFGVGSDLTWQAEGSLGMLVTQNVFSELGYRALGVDYQSAGMHMETITHGLQLTLGLQF